LKSDWLADAYFVQYQRTVKVTSLPSQTIKTSVPSYAPQKPPSKYKLQLLELIEYNKIAIIESSSYLQQSTEIEIVITTLMRSRIMDE
jgi:hypothetical protein